MSRDNMRFDIHYNEYMEKYLCTFWGRIEKIILFAQIFLGTMVFANVSGTAVYGAVMAALGVFSVVYTPGKKSHEADIQIIKYAKLRLIEETMSDEELRAEIIKSSESGSDPIGSFSAPAYLRAAIKFDLETKDIPKLTFLEKCFAWFGGDLPRA
ncbi:hypothetical protein GOZ68_07505 [Vibrio parahaemolyticus]|nr:hypothetical protein [Vibrio parahaemolyticus]